MGITKNHLDSETIIDIFSNKFPNKKIENIKELTEGMFNATYDITFEDGSESILKVSPKDKQGLMSNEINLMWAEVQAMQIMKKYDFVHVAEVQLYDNSKELCDSGYFVMERIEGENWIFIKDGMSKTEKDIIHNEIGVIHKNMSSIKNEKFGLLGDSKRFDTLYEFFNMLMCNVLDDVDARDIEIGVPKNAILAQLEKDQFAFDEVKVPSLVHWDMWEGNIFVKNNHVSGVIDWERAMWGEPFMDDRFRRHSRNEEFLKGYGQKDFSNNEMRRINWYDVFLFITMMAEVTYRQYSDNGQYYWVKPLLESAWNDLIS